MNMDQISAESASRVYGKVNGKLAEVADVKCVHTAAPSQDFEAIKNILGFGSDVKTQNPATLSPDRQSW
jgi:hypothetical protein